MFCPPFERVENSRKRSRKIGGRKEKILFLAFWCGSLREAGRADENDEMRREIGAKRGEVLGVRLGAMRRVLKRIYKR